HDSAGQLLVTLHWALDEARRQLGDEAASHLDPVRARIDEVGAELRRLSHELRPTMLDDLGLLHAVRPMGGGLERRAGVVVRVHGDLNPRLPPLVETTLYRVIQEALANVARHAGAATVDVILEWSDGVVCCYVRDDGIGFDPSAACAGTGGGLGL